jgi:hypothetical protein
VNPTSIIDASASWFLAASEHVNQESESHRHRLATPSTGVTSNAIKPRMIAATVIAASSKYLMPAILPHEKPVLAHWPALPLSQLNSCCTGPQFGQVMFM